VLLLFVCLCECARGERPDFLPEQPRSNCVEAELRQWKKIAFAGDPSVTRHARWWWFLRVTARQSKESSAII
jgi:hypothetical protein